MGFLSSLFGGGKQQISTQSSIPAFMQPYMQSYLGSAQNLYNNNTPRYFQGDQVADLNGMQGRGINALFGAGNRGFSFDPQSTGLLNRTMKGDFLRSNPLFGQLQQEASGKYLNSNPYLDSIYKSNLNSSLDDIQARFAGSGRSGGSGYMGNAMGEAAGRVTDQVFGQNYENERNRQQQAQGLLNSIYGQERNFQNAAIGESGLRSNQNWLNDMQGYNAMLQAGGLRQQQNQAEIDANKAKFDWQQNLPYWKLNQYGNALGMGTQAGTNTTTTGPGANKMGNALGMGMMGAGLGASIPGWGAGAGTMLGPAGWALGGLGLLGGLFS
jgi:hypothetical protein